MIIESVRQRGLRHLIDDHNPQFIQRDLTQRIIAVVTALGNAEDISQFVATAPRGWRVHRLAWHFGETDGAFWYPAIGGLPLR